MERRILGHGEIQTWMLTFDGNITDGFTAQLRGEASE